MSQYNIPPISCPPNELALPVEVVNDGLFSISDVSAEITDNIICKNNNITKGNITYAKISPLILSNNSASYIYNSISIQDPISGFVKVKISYHLSLIRKLFQKEETFYLYRNKDNSVHWIKK